MRLLSSSQTLRFALRSPDKDSYSSDRWSIRAQSGEIYIFPASSGGIQKVSLHKSGVCRCAFTENLALHKPPFVDGDRLVGKWRRRTHKSVLHSHAFSLLFILGDTWKEIPRSNKKVKLLDLPPKNGSREVAVFYSETNPLDWQEPVWPTTNILGVWQLSDKLFVAVRHRVAPFEDSRRTEILRTIRSRRQTKVYIGQENPQQTSFGHDTCNLLETTDDLGTLITVQGVACLDVGRNADWFTRDGHRPPEN